MLRQILSVILIAFLACSLVTAGNSRLNTNLSEKLIGNISLNSKEVVIGVAFSPDGSRLAYTTKDADGMWAVNLDGRSGSKFDGIDFPRFSPDGRHFAYAAKSGAEWFMVLDGKKGPGYYRLSGLTFSQDSNRSAYAATSNNRTFMVIDGRDEGLKVDNITSFMFSPKGDRYAYIGVQEDTQFVIADGIKGPDYDKINLIEFSSDGSHLAYLVTDEFFKKKFVVLDGQKGKDYDRVVVIKGRLFEPEGDFHYVGIRGNEAYLIRADLSP